MDKTPEQVAQEAAQAEAALAAKKTADAAAKAALAATKKAEADKVKADKKAAADAAKAAKEAEKAAKLKAAADKKAEAEKAAAAKAATKTVMPEQNGVRRPKADGQCGKAWALMDDLSRTLGQPVPIANLIASAALQTPPLNEGNVRAEYARWRKFNGVTGRVTLPVVTPAVAPWPLRAAGAPAA